MDRKNRTTTNNQRITIADWTKKAAAKLGSQQIESARLDALLLLEHVVEKGREWVLAHEDDELNKARLGVLNTMLDQRLAHIPLAYIIGSKEFYGHEFLVDENVLIPRPETEVMIDLLKAEVLRYTQDDGVRWLNTIVDIGTGSGCLAVSVKLLYPEVHVIAVDNSSKALKVAQKNARLHGVQIQFKNMDIADGLPAMPKTRPYIILANLPYVPDGLVTSEEITKEPEAALFSGKDGFDHYRILWKQIAAAKNKPFCVFIESLEAQHNFLSKMAEEAGYQLEQSRDLIQFFYWKN